MARASKELWPFYLGDASALLRPELGAISLVSSSRHYMSGRQVAYISIAMIS